MASVQRSPFSVRNQGPSEISAGNPASPFPGGAGAAEVKMYKLPKLVVRPTSPKRHNQISLIKISRDGGVMKPGAYKRKSPSEDNTAAVVASTAPNAPKAPAVSEAAPAAPTSAPEVAGPSVPAVKAAAPPRPARVAPSPAPVANELAVQLRQLTEAEAASRGPQPGSDNDLAQVPFFFSKRRCGDACCPQPFAERPAMAREVGCTAGCVVRFHSGACSHGSAVSAAWAGPGMPCPTPDCGGKTLYAVELHGAGVIKADKYGKEAKADFDEAARQRKKRAAAEQERAAAKKAAKKAGMQARGATNAKKAATPTAAAPATRPAVQAAAPVMPALAAAAAQAEREAREEKAAALVQRSDPVLVLPPRTPSPLAAPRQHHRNSPPPLPQAARGRSSLGNAEPINTENAWLRRRAASTGAVSAAEDDEQLIHLAGRYASSCASAEADSGDSSGGEEALAMPSLPAQVAGDSAVNLTSVAAFWAAVDAQASLQAFAVSFAPLSPAKDDVAKDEVAPVPPKSYKAAIELKAVAHPAAVATAAPAVVPAAPLVLRLGAAPHLQSLHKTELCRWWALGCCTRGEDCTFAHGAAEQRCKPVFRCHYFDGPQGCYYGEACKYSHEAQGC